MCKNIFLLFVLIAEILFLSACNKTGFAGAGKYKVHLRVEGKNSYVSAVNLEYWDSKYNNHSVQNIVVPDNVSEFTTQEYKVGRVINIATSATNFQELTNSKSGTGATKIEDLQSKVTLIVELFRNGKVVRKTQRSANGHIQVFLKTPLEKK